ncbi:MAG: hypothetical protein V3W41_18725, partial [Planctomycetota bacterium]
MVPLKTTLFCLLCCLWLPLFSRAGVGPEPVLLVPKTAFELNHPSDGPDVDLRLRLEADELVVTVIVNLAFCDEFLDLAREDE